MRAHSDDNVDQIAHSLGSKATKQHKPKHGIQKTCATTSKTPPNQSHHTPPVFQQLKNPVHHFTPPQILHKTQKSNHRNQINAAMIVPSCFSNPNTHSNHSEMPQNLVTCVYQTHLCNTDEQLCYLTLTWCKTVVSHTLTIHASPDLFSTTISLYPSSFSLFRSKSGSKSIALNAHNSRNRVKLHWDFTKASFAHNSAEPTTGFFFSIVCNAQIKFLLGDLRDDAIKRSGSARLGPKSVEQQPTLLSRREHVFGRKRYATTAQFLGAKHEIGIECGGGALKVKIDGSVSLVVKRLGWKFRGNERILVGGVDVEFYWDVLNWVSGGSNGHGVFVFQVGDGGVWPEMVGAEKRLMRKSTSGPVISLSPPLLSSSSSVLQWAEESSDGGRSSCSSSTTRSCGSGGGFSLLLYAWRNN